VDRNKIQKKLENSIIISGIFIK